MYTAIRLPVKPWQLDLIFLLLNPIVFMLPLPSTTTSERSIADVFCLFFVVSLSVILQPEQMAGKKSSKRNEKDLCTADIFKDFKSKQAPAQ